MNAPLAPCPTTMSIVGDATGILAYNKFAVFALVCSLLVPRAGKRFRSALRHERFQQKQTKQLSREIDRHEASERRLEQLLNTVEERLFFRHQPRTVRTISAKPFNPPSWSGDVKPTDVVVPLYSAVPTKNFLLNLVRQLGYDPAAAMSPFSSWWVSHQPKPKLPTQFPEVSRDALMKALSRMKTRNPDLRTAVQEVIMGKESARVAKRYGLNLASLQVTVSRVRRVMETFAEPFTEPA